jgi:hypothetical protein
MRVLLAIFPLPLDSPRFTDILKFRIIGLPRAPRAHKAVDTLSRSSRQPLLRGRTPQSGVGIMPPPSIQSPRWSQLVRHAASDVRMPPTAVPSIVGRQIKRTPLRAGVSDCASPSSKGARRFDVSAHGPGQQEKCPYPRMAMNRGDRRIHNSTRNRAWLVHG